MTGYFRPLPDLAGCDGELWKFPPSHILPFDQQITYPHLTTQTYSCNNYYYYSVGQQPRPSSAAPAFQYPHSQSFPGCSFSQESQLSPPSHSFVGPPPSFWQFRPNCQCVCGSGSFPVRSHSYKGCLSSGTNHVRTGSGNQAFNARGLPIHPHHHFTKSNPNPVFAQSERFGELRPARPSVEQQRRASMTNRVGENPFVPNSGGNRVGYGRGDHVGTGVFLPRVPVKIKSSSSISADRMDDRRRIRWGDRKDDRNGEEPRILIALTNEEAVEMEKQEEDEEEDYLHRSQVCLELGLPEDWTY